MRGKEADVDLEVVAEGEGDFVLAAGHEVIDEGKGGDVLDGSFDDVGLAGGAGGEEVEVADGFAAAAEGAGGGDLVDAGELEDEGGDAVGLLAGLVDAEARGVAAVVLDALEELGGELFAHTGKLVEVASLGGGFEGLHIGNLQGGPDQGDGFGAHAGEPEEVEHGGAVAGEELVAEGHGAGGDEVADVGGHAFADAGNGEESFGIGFGSDEGGELDGLLLDGLGGAAIGADAEEVGTVYFEEGGGFVEKAGESDVIHTEHKGERSVRGGYAPLHDCRRCEKELAEQPAGCTQAWIV